MPDRYHRPSCLKCKQSSLALIDPRLSAQDDADASRAFMTEYHPAKYNRETKGKFAPENKNMRGILNDGAGACACGVVMLIMSSSRV